MIRSSVDNWLFHFKNIFSEIFLLAYDSICDEDISFHFTAKGPVLTDVTYYTGK